MSLFEKVHQNKKNIKEHNKLIDRYEKKSDIDVMKVSLAVGNLPIS